MLSGHEYGYSIDWWNFGVLLYIMVRAVLFRG